MPIEKKPQNPLPTNYIPPGGIRHAVKTGEDLKSLAKNYHISEADLMRFNFATADPAEVNWYLHHSVGCKQTTRDGKNWIFTTGVQPGVIYFPTATVPKISIHHEVKLFPQPTNMTCWSAAATMMFGDQSIGPGTAHVDRTGGLDFNYANIGQFAQSLGLQMEAPQSWSPQALADILKTGPVMVTGRMLPNARGVPQPHAVVIAGMLGDGTPAGTQIEIRDPWPPGVGGSGTVNYQTFMTALPQATTYLLHR